MHDDYLDDNVVIPEDIKRMTQSELEAEIARLEAELKLKKQSAGSVDNLAV